MVSTFHSIETARRGLIAQQAALNTTGHNVANANTIGYSRQRVNLAATSAIEAYGMNSSTTPGQLGTGVEFTSITRIRSSFLDQQFREQNSLNASWNVKADALSMLEGVVNEPSDTGLRTVMSEFFNAWSDLSKDPTNVTNRTLVAQKGAALADTFNQLSTQMTDYQSDLSDNVTTSASDITSKLQTIASLNQQIRKLEAYGNNANDLRDQRDNLTDELSSQINIEVSETEENGYTIKMGGTQLVSGDTALTITSDTLNDAYTSGVLTGGSVYGTIEARDKITAGYLNQLNTLANTIANGQLEVTIPAGSVLPGTTTPTTAAQVITVNGMNGLHHLGYTLDTPAQSGLDLFTSSSGSTITAGTFRFNPVIVSDPTRIATSLRTETKSGVTTAIQGDNSLSLIFSELADNKFTIDQTATGGTISQSTLNDFYSALVGALGVQSEDAQRQVKNTQSQVDQVDNNRASVSGVSLDEEMSNLVVFQHAYSASARLMTTMDELLDKLINGTGRVGL